MLWSTILVMPILHCRFPFPEQDPPLVLHESCSAKCPRYDAEVLTLRKGMESDDPELVVALRSFADWLYVPGQDLEEQIRFAGKLYVREDHEGTCLPKTLLFMHYKHLQFTYDEPLELSKEARAAFKGKVVGSWPDGERCAGSTWNEMFAEYSRRYE